MNPSEFSKIISRFFGVSSKILLKSGVWLGRLVGDQIIGMYIPYYVGGNHQLAAIEAAKALLRATGHDSADGPWIPLGVDVHCGNAFVGTVGSHDAATDITVLDDAPNAAAKLLSAAAAGEIMLSDGAYDIAGLTDDLERRTLELKVKSEPMGVCVLTDISK